MWKTYASNKKFLNFNLILLAVIYHACLIILLLLYDQIVFTHVKIIIIIFT